MKAVRFCTDIFVWGEDLTDKKLIIYPQKVKCIDDYISKKDRLKACGVVLINPEDSDPVHLVTATVDIESGDLYVHESGFNHMWKYIRNIINAVLEAIDLFFNNRTWNVTQGTKKTEAYVCPLFLVPKSSVSSSKKQ